MRLVTPLLQAAMLADSAKRGQDTPQMRALPTREFLSHVDKAQQILAEVGRVIVGKNPEIRLLVECLLARGHALLEDKPGLGKTVAEALLALIPSTDWLARLRFPQCLDTNRPSGFNRPTTVDLSVSNHK